MTADTTPGSTSATTVGPGRFHTRVRRPRLSGIDRPGRAHRHRTTSRRDVTTD
jgi:hypothetical protein